MTMHKLVEMPRAYSGQKAGGSFPESPKDPNLSGFRVWGSGFRVQCFGVWGLGFREPKTLNR